MLVGDLYMLMLETVKHVTITYNLGDLADWVSAIGTFLAVAVSLYFANKRDRPHIWIELTGDKYKNCRLTNKSFQPVELQLKRPGDSYYTYFPLPPMKNRIQNFKDSQVFQNDYIAFAFSPKDKSILSAKGFDIVTMSKYYFAFYKDEDKWKIKQLKNFITWQLYLYWRRFREGLQKN